MNKTPQELAEEYADKKHNYNPNFPRDVQHNYDVWLESCEDFLAGFIASVEQRLNQNTKNLLNYIIKLDLEDENT